MGLFYKVSPKEMTDLRKNIFLEKGIPALSQKGFVRSPFSTFWYGYQQGIGYSYYLCRLTDNSALETITVDIVRGDRWIQIKLNIFELSPAVTSIQQLTGIDALQYGLAPHTASEMRLRIDDRKRVPIFDISNMYRHHKIYSYHTPKGLKRRASQLGNRIEKDLLNIDDFIKRWKEKYKINKTNWEGQAIS